MRKGWLNDLPRIGRLDLTGNLAVGVGDGEGAVSTWVAPVRRMEFPYHDIIARLMVNCDRAWVRFSGVPNLTGFEYHYVPIKIDGKSAGLWRMYGSGSTKDVSFVNDSEAIFAMSRGNKLGLVFSWYGEGRVAFEWSLKRSTEMIRASCQ